MRECQPLHTICYRGLEPVTIYSRWDWYLDKTYPKNFVHHIMSFRWLKDVSDVDTRNQIINSWTNYHNSDGKKSKFYLGRDADHSASVRLRVLLNIMEENDDCSLRDDEAVQNVSGEIDKIIESCLKGKTYKKGHNHGLMVDLSLIYALDKKASSRYRESILSVVPDRILEQLKAIFSDEGACKEHSISYQEYNLNVLHSLRKNLNKKKGTHPPLDELLKSVEVIYQRVKKESKKLLGYGLVAGGYMPLGDTFSQPKEKVLEKVYGSMNAREALRPYSTDNGYYFSKSSGYFLFRSTNFQLGFTACWHSRVHKQNDDLAIVLYDDSGKPVVLDGGFSDMPIDFDHRSAESHSTFFPRHSKWKSRDKGDLDYSTLELLDHSDDCLTVRGLHNRVEGSVLSRVLTVCESGVSIEDFCDPRASSVHRFILPKCKVLEGEDSKEVEVIQGSRRVKLVFSSTEIAVSKGLCVIDGMQAEVDFVDVISEGDLTTEITFC